MTHNRPGHLAVAGTVVGIANGGAVVVEWAGEGASRTTTAPNRLDLAPTPGSRVLYDGCKAVVWRVHVDKHHFHARYDIRVWDPQVREPFAVEGVPRGAFVVPPQRRAALATLDRARGRYHRFSTPPDACMLEALCVEGPSTATPIRSLGGSAGSGVFARVALGIGTRLFWDLSDTRLLRLAACGPLGSPLRRYGMLKQTRPVPMLLCPGRRGFADRARPGTIGIGFRVNFAGPGDTVNVELRHAGWFGDAVCFVVVLPVAAGSELLFLPDFHGGCMQLRTKV